MIRSPSQCPGTARSSTSAGRSLMMNLGGHERLAPPTRARPRHSQRSASPQALRQLALQRASALNVERLVDRLMADAHRRVIRIVEPQSLGDLLWAPCQAPSSAPASPVPSTFPKHCRAGNRNTAGSNNGARKPILHIGSQRRVRREFCRFRTTRRPLRVPLRGRRPVIKVAAARCRVAPQLPRDRRWRSSQPTGDLPHTNDLPPVTARSPRARQSSGNARTSA